MTWDAIAGADDRQRVGVMGWPVAHSVSPAMHNAAFEALSLDWVYTRIPTPPDRLEQVLQGLRQSGYRGVNVTVPHKQAVIPHLDDLTEAARSIGAVNTILSRDGRWIGDNTDWDGFLSSLREAGFEPAGQRALVLGAGGAARAVLYALAHSGCSVAVLSRAMNRAADLVLEMGHIPGGSQMTSLPISVSLTQGTAGRVLEQLADVVSSSGFDLLVNTTPVGMWPAVDDSPWPDGLELPSSWTVFDLVYNPLETRLLARARANGANAVDGLGMLVHQGARAFELWTGHRPPLGMMRQAAQDALAQQEGASPQR